jgi:hypothetical protein
MWKSASHPRPVGAFANRNSVYNYRLLRMAVHVFPLRRETHHFFHAFHMLSTRLVVEDCSASWKSRR